LDRARSGNGVEGRHRHRRRAPSSLYGLGKPEPLRGNYKGWWSRRITDEHRLVYRVTGSGAAQAIEIAQCRFHY
jgi:toxin YoeB